MSNELFDKIFEGLMVRPFSAYLFPQSEYGMLDQWMTAAVAPPTVQATIDDGYSIRLVDDDTLYYLSYIKITAALQQIWSTPLTCRRFNTIWSKLREVQKIPAVTHGANGSSTVLKINGAGVKVPLALTITVQPWRGMWGGILNDLYVNDVIPPMEFVQVCILVSMEAALQGDTRKFGHCGHDILTSGPAKLLGKSEEKSEVNERAVQPFPGSPTVAFMYAAVLLEKALELTHTNEGLTEELRLCAASLRSKKVAWPTPPLCDPLMIAYEGKEAVFTHNLGVYLNSEDAPEEFSVRKHHITGVTAVPFEADERLKSEIKALTKTIQCLYPERFDNYRWLRDDLLRSDVLNHPYFDQAGCAYDESQEPEYESVGDLDKEADAAVFGLFLSPLETYETPYYPQVARQHERASKRMREIMGQYEQTLGGTDIRFGAFKGPIT